MQQQQPSGHHGVAEDLPVGASGDLLSISAGKSRWPVRRVVCGALTVPDDGCQPGDNLARLLVILLVFPQAYCYAPNMLSGLVAFIVPPPSPLG